MHFNLDKMMAGFEPWDLSVSFDGTTYYPTRQWTKADELKLAGLVDMEEEQVYQFLESIFPAEKPDVRQWDENITVCLIASMRGYADQRRINNMTMARAKMMKLASKE